MKALCEICQKEFERITPTHLKKHNITMPDYILKYGSAKLSSDETKRKSKVTKSTMIRKWGEDDGLCRWENYKLKQAKSNSYEYKRDKHGWTRDQYNEYNKSRGSVGEKNGMYGTSYYDKWVEWYGKEKADELNAELGPLKAQGALSRKGAPLTTEARQNMSKAAIERIKRQGTYISYNPHACKVIDLYGEDFGYNFQHAENGGEFLVPNVYFYVDGYDDKRNVVIEYYELAHKYKINKDDERIRAIRNELDCKVIIIREENRRGDTRIEIIED
jgi:hypothetical protein